MIPLSEIVKAKRQLAGVVTNTPCALAPILSEEVGTNVYLKKENLQITGAYKLRGAYNKIASLTKEERKKGVIAASAGNHAQGVAYSARVFGIQATIVMPEATPLLKVTGTKALGAEVILQGDNYDEAYAYALTYANEHGLTFIHPFEDEKVIAGQGTVALEMIDEINDLDVVVVPIGGGGLISGMSSAIKQIDPKIKVIGVNASGAPAMCESFHAKQAINSKSVRTIADGIAVRDVSESNLAHILECVDEVVTVDDEEIASAILFLLERQKLVVEGGGAASVAAIMHKKFAFDKHTKIGAVLSGGNIDVQVLSIIIEKGLIKSHRKMKLVITLIDKPGALMRLTDLFKNANANIIQIDYDRFSTKLSYGDAQITIMLETKGVEHQAMIRELLNDAKYPFIEEV
ncbi:MAG: threonine ammonia-lyase [Epsilonproteobacteria bacterium]|jgi:threonine dehydratase|uniref:threonine ammonia-lyase n=1 Tax=Sulfurospirillum TaxID=57665 RepID=UPI0005438864|nr:MULTISPECIES: threonine ammonia-lyase [Sulfurospirillum]NCB54166.1 threonine ammonia-lyase [Campylobacterota bacterium]KHG33686.1 MAG: threonine dehydratase [Sulfurospirillum sp. MES]MCD8545699.1 threonine ammonia-lyase [Sulfurospirillum cavolei]MCP3651195.1 threonine ammonia-lyase [Sulfurospirillum sp. DNRA8]MCR1810041.1 threonine ammonia-lyase [Sulfurospirillum sp. DNRA8]